MKEFAEKLIERLEYLRKDKYVMAPTVCYVLENVEEIVNQLVEELADAILVCAEQVF